MLDDPGPSWPLIIAAIVFVLLFLSTPFAAAHETQTISGYFKPSVKSSYSYTWHYSSFLNYCPACGHYNCLLINPKGVPERELTCSRCDADYDGCTGWEKSGSYRWRLIKHYKKKIKKVVRKVVKKTREQLIREKWDLFREEHPLIGVV